MDIDHDNQLISYRIPVPTEFEEVFSHFYYAENNTNAAVTKTFLPSFQTILLFSFGCKVSLTSPHNHQIDIDKCIIVGPIKQPFEYILPIGAEILVANFKSDSLYRFFGQILLSEFLTIHPDELSGENCFTQLWHDLKAINSPYDKTEYILNFCNPYLKNREIGSDLLVNRIKVKPSLNPIKVISQETGKSERMIQINHKKYLGYSAKEINRYQRFLKAVGLLQDASTNSDTIDWFDIIDKCGYYDQSQLIHDFKFYINLSPTKFLEFEQDICIASI